MLIDLRINIEKTTKKSKISNKHPPTPPPLPKKTIKKTPI